MLRFTLYENAIDSINHGIEHFELAYINDSNRDYKQAVLLIFQGTELLLKSLLGQDNVVNIFDKNSLFDKCKDPMNPTIDELSRCKSIEISKIIREVYRVYPEEFSKSSLRIVEKMSTIRNQVQHFGVKLAKNEVVSKLGQLYLEVISVGLNLLGNIINPDKNEALDEEIQKVFCFFEVADNEEKVLNIIGYDVARGCCINCNNYSLFMTYSKNGYPESIHCSSCDFKLDDIDVDEFRVCPECGANALLYIPVNECGLCTWHKCCTHRDGGIPIEMSKCEVCKDYVIEGDCVCGYSENVDDE